jgi:hypothetical protein
VPFEAVRLVGGGRMLRAAKPYGGSEARAIRDEKGNRRLAAIKVLTNAHWT